MKKPSVPSWTCGLHNVTGQFYQIGSIWHRASFRGTLLFREKFCIGGKKGNLSEANRLTNRPSIRAMTRLADQELVGLYGLARNSSLQLG